jgi:hypothetical protein
MSKRLEKAIEATYAAFCVPKPAIVEGCPCCQDQRELCALLETSLRRLSAHDLLDYAMSVFWTAGGEYDFRYFLPRLLELAIRNRDGFWISPDMLLYKLHLGNWLKWDGRERQTVEDLLLAWFDDELDKKPPSGRSLDSLICGAAIAGVDPSNFLQRLETNSDALNAVYEVNTLSLWKSNKLANDSWSHNRAAGAAIVAFFRSESVQKRLKLA